MTGRRKNDTYKGSSGCPFRLEKTAFPLKDYSMVFQDVVLFDDTVLVIAHRMRTVESADKIVVLSEGRVAEEGNPAELLSRKDSIFGRMTQLQNASAGWSL